VARADLFGIYDHIEQQAGTARAGRYVQRIEAACLRLAMFPRKGTPRDDIAPGLRTWSVERRVLILYQVSNELVQVMRVLYAGRDFQAGSVPR
jgi:toxin ParE1/3/4